MLNIKEDGPSSYATLTEKQMEILRFMEKGDNNKQMAEQCLVTPETVKTHIKHIYEKLEVINRLQAMQCAKELGLV